MTRRKIFFHPPNMGEFCLQGKGGGVSSGAGQPVKIDPA